MMQLVEFVNREELDDYLLMLNYDMGISPELACIDKNQNVFLACGTEEGDAMGIAYYFTNEDGYMYHYGVEYDGDRSFRNWVPTFPVSALAPSK